MDKPWSDSDSWPQSVTSNAKKSVFAAWAIAGLWNLISWPSAMVLPDELAKGNHAALLVLLFPAVGLFLLRYAVRVTREWRTYGVTELSLDPYPGAIGGHVGGVVRLRQLDPARAVEVCLECVRCRVRSSGGKRRQETEVIWQTNGEADVTPVAAGVEIRFRFDVPAGLPASDDPEQADRHLWQLQVRSRQPGVDLARTFEIGVFPTAERSTHIQIDTGARAAAEADRVLTGAMMDQTQRVRLLDEHGLEVDQRDGWLRLYLRQGRQRGMALMTFLIGAAFLVVPFVVPDQDFSSGVIRFAFGSFGICLLVLSLYLPFNSLDVRISRRKLKRVRSWFGMVVRAQEIRPEELEELEIDKGSSTTTGNTTTIYYELVGKGKFGRFKLIESIPDRMLVEAIRRQVMIAAGLKPSATH